jgi:hypothetical protein
MKCYADIANQIPHITLDHCNPAGREPDDNRVFYYHRIEKTSKRDQHKTTSRAFRGTANAVFQGKLALNDDH